MNRKEALKFMRRCLIEDNGKVDTEVKEAIRALVPELTESEDERILASLTHCVGLMGEDGTVFSSHNVTKVSVLSWIEKQKELKSLVIAPNQFDGITYGMQGHSTAEPAELSEDERIREWLINDIQTAIVDGLYNIENIEKARAAVTYLEKQKEPVMKEPGLYYYDGEKVTYCGFPPIKDNPYDFAMSQEKKQKPTNPFSGTCFNYNGHHYGICARDNGIEVTKDGVLIYRSVPPFIGQNLVTEEYIANVFEKVGLAKIVREQGNDALTNAVQSAMIELSQQEKQKEQKPDENVTDKEIKQAVDDIHNFKVAVTDLAKTFNIRIDHNRDIDWHNFCAFLLTYLKRHAEWSEGDESYLQTVINEMEANKKEAREYEHKKYDAIILWLKSLLSHPKPSGNWKPSKYILSLVKKVADGEMLTGVEQMAMGTFHEELEELEKL